MVGRSPTALWDGSCTFPSGKETEMKNYVRFMTFYDVSVKVAVRITTINTGGCRVNHVLPRIEHGLGIGLYIYGHSLVALSSHHAAAEVTSC